MTLKFLVKFEKLLQAKLASLVGKDDRTWLYCDEVKKTFDWCNRQGIGYSWKLHRCLQVFDSDKHLIASVRVLEGENQDFYFIVPLDLAEKALLLNALPE